MARVPSRADRIGWVASFVTIGLALVVMSVSFLFIFFYREVISKEPVSAVVVDKKLFCFFICGRSLVVKHGKLTRQFDVSVKDYELYAIGDRFLACRVELKDVRGINYFEMKNKCE